MFQAPAPAENPAEFQRITQIPRNSPTHSANYVSDRFQVLFEGRTPFLAHIMSQIVNL